MDFAQAMHFISIALLPMLLGIILHEIAHGWVALKMGDPTARMQGRLTLNPVAHFDPMGALFFLFTAFASSAGGFPFILGWAKPVPVNPGHFRNFKQGMLFVSLAGAAANLLLALFFALGLRLALSFMDIPQHPSPLEHSFLIKACYYGVIINCTLAWFNLLPIPPLDGSKVLACLLPSWLAGRYLALGRYGFIILVLLLATNLLGKVVWPLVRWSADVLFSLVSLI